MFKLCLSLKGYSRNIVPTRPSSRELIGIKVENGIELRLHEPAEVHGGVLGTLPDDGTGVGADLVEVLEHHVVGCGAASGGRAGGGCRAAGGWGQRLQAGPELIQSLLECCFIVSTDDGPHVIGSLLECARYGDSRIDHQQAKWME